MQIIETKLLSFLPVLVLKTAFFRGYEINRDDRTAA